MNALILAPRYNSPGKYDATGAFQSEANYFRAHHGLPNPSVYLFDNKLVLSARRKQVISEMKRRGVFDTLAVFSHGTKTSTQAGMDLASAKSLAQALQVAQCGKVILYCCDTARDLDVDRADDAQDNVGGKKGFADRLVQECSKIGHEIVVYAHSTLGHTSRNPYVRCFYTSNYLSRTPGSLPPSGEFLVPPWKPEWKQWVAALKGSMRFRYPFLTQNQILAELAAPAHA